MDYIKVMDKNGKCNNWVVEFDMGDYYEVFYREHITALRKDKCFMFEGQMMSSEIRNFHEDDNIGASRVIGSEQCSVCFREIYNNNRLNVMENSDKYICKKCTKSLKIAVKPAII